MITVVGKRGSGKTSKLFKLAREKNAMILAANSRALQAKAKAMGYDDIEIIGFGNLKNDDFSFAKEVLVDECDAILSYLLEKYYCLKLGGVSLTVEEV